MSKLLIAGAFVVFSAAAGAAETGIINQSGPYETTMRFYLHPALGFPGKAETMEPRGGTANVEEKSRAPTSREPEGIARGPSQASGTDPDHVDRVATRKHR